MKAKRSKNIFYIVLALLALPLIFRLFSANSASAAWYNTSWLYRKSLVFNNSAQTSNLTDFPALVVLSSSNFTFSEAKTNGEDIRFTDSNGTTLLPYEIETYDSVGQTARIWIKVPQINASSSTDSIYMYWGNAAANDAQDADNTWASQYKGVYHLNNNATSTTVTDSSGLGNDITSAENTNNGYYQSAGKIGGGFLTGGTPTYITNQSGSNISEAYPDIVLDSNGYPVIAYTDLTTFDLVLVHCNDKECKGGNETVSTVDSTNTTGYYPSIQLDSNGYPMIAYQYVTGVDLKYVHCNDVNCAGGDETFSVIETTNSTGYYPRMVKDGSGFPVIAYYYGTGLDLKLVHCGNVDCNSGNVTNTIDSTGTVGNGFHGTDLVLDGSGFPIMSYYDTTNTELKVAHCNDVNCAGADEAINSPLSTLSKSLGIYTAIELDGTGLPMIAYYNATDLNLEFLHCDDANCAGDETTQRVIVETGTSTAYPSMEKNSSGLPIILSAQYNVYPQVHVCANTNCSTSTRTYLALYNQYGSSYFNFKLDGNNNIFAMGYAFGKTGDRDAVLYTTQYKLDRAYDSDFDFGTGSFSVSAWFKTNGMAQKNYLLSRYDADQGFKLGLNYAGRACFEIDDDASWGPDDSACSSNSQISMNVDSNNASNATWNSMVLDGNGYPIITYFEDGTDDLEIIHCNDANCTGSNETFASIDTGGDVGRTPSMVLDASGFPVIAYHDNTNQDLKLVHCGNANCSSGNTINTVDSSAGDVGDYPTLKLDGSGFPVISYYDTTNTAVKLAHCNDVNCSGADESIVTLVNDEDDRVRHGSESLQLDTSGYPMVVYSDITNYDLKYIHCNDANCDGVGETKTTIETANTISDFASMTLDSNGYPVIIHTDQSFSNMRIVHCGNADCSNGNVTGAINTPNDGYTGYYELDIKLNSSGYPVILSTQLPTYSTVLTVCNDVNCSGGDETNSLIRDETNNVYYHSLALDGSGYPVIGYAGGGWDLRLIHMTNGTTYTETGNYDDSQWHHLGAVKDNNSAIYLYVDGVLVGSDTAVNRATLTSNSASLNLAEEITNALAVNNWSGYLDEVQLDNTARTADWVAAQYLSESNTFINQGTTEPGPAAVSLGTFTDNSGALRNNLVGYWKFDEGYGGTANNSSTGGAPNGTIDNATWSMNGKYGKAINCELDTSEEIDLGSTVETETELTLSAWINPESHTTTGAIIGEGGAYRFYINSAGKIVFVVIGNPTDTVSTLTSTNSVIVDGSWQHVAATWDGAGTWALYYNGKRISDNGGANSTTSLDGVDSDNGTICNYWNNYASAHFDGLIDEVKIYNAALTADEVKQDYNHGSAISLGSLSDTSALTGGSIASNSATATYCVPGSTDPCSAPVGEWNFEEAVDNTCTGGVNDVCDKSGSGNDGAWNGTGNHWDSGKFGKAGKFNGTDDYLNLGTYNTLNGATAFTVSAWIYKEEDGNFPTYDGIFGIGGAGQRTPWIYGSQGSASIVGYFETTTGGSTDCFVTSSPIASNAWSFITLQWNGSVCQLYVNGSPSGSSDTTTGNTLANTDGINYIGRLNGFDYWNGSIDQIRVYSYARTPAQIAWDYNQGKPIAHWKLNECTGTVANDSSGNANTGTITIGATGTNTTAGTCTTSGSWFDGATGKFNSSLDFDGTDDYVQLANASSPNPTSDLTVSSWIKLASLANTTNYNIFAKQTWGSKLGFRLAIGGHGGCADLNCLFLGVGNGTTQTETTGSGVNLPDVGTWHHVVGTFSSGSIKLYVDGKQRYTTTSTVTSIVNDAVAGRIGKHSTGSEYFPGQIDDVRIYNYALTPAQIKMVYNEGSSLRFGP